MPNTAQRSMVKSPNFAFLSSHKPILVEYTAQAEKYVFDDPNTSLIKLRQFIEILAQQSSAYSGLFSSPDESLVDLLDRLRTKGILSPLPRTSRAPSSRQSATTGGMSSQPASFPPGSPWGSGGSTVQSDRHGKMERDARRGTAGHRNPIKSPDARDHLAHVNMGVGLNGEFNEKTRRKNH